MEKTSEKDIVIIDFKDIFIAVWSHKWWVILVTSVFLLLGLRYAFTAREEFVSRGKIMPEISGGGSSSLGGLANLVGIGGFELGLKNSTDAIRPDLYPDVIKSVPFFLNLFKEGFIDKNGDSLIFSGYYHKEIEERKELSEELMETFTGKPDGVVIMNLLTELRIKDLKKRISVDIDKKSGVISISVTMPDPIVSAGVANFAMNYLTEYVTNYRTEKIKREVDFLGRKVAASKGEFYKDQSRKANYADSFASSTIRLQSADVQRERLESEYKLSSSVYNELLKKYEEAKIKLQQETPVFQVLEPPIVSNIRSSPKRSLIVLIAGMGGVIFSFFLIFVKINFNRLKTVLKDT